ncbi:hypothetical protein [Haladaptatus sp. DFWS20]|uniref:hypothetical protein n=1 Tax=Haladaptatus sp. DFWS20 TaxID=3403467 RepID=UPI003EB92462
MFEDVEILVLDLLTLSVFFPEVEQFGVLFRALDRLEELATCIGCFRGEVRRIVVNALFSLVISHEVDYTRHRRPNSCILHLCFGEIVDVRFHGLGHVFETTEFLSVLGTLFRRLLAIVFEFIDPLAEVCVCER